MFVLMVATDNSDCVTCRLIASDNDNDESGNHGFIIGEVPGWRYRKIIEEKVEWEKTSERRGLTVEDEWKSRETREKLNWLN
jgi:hypothetical protein